MAGLQGRWRADGRVERCLDPMAARRVGALADQLGLLETKLLGRIGYPLVDVAEERFRLRYA